MLSEDVKQAIQSSYSQLLESRGLSPRQGQKLMIAAIARTLAGTVSQDGSPTETPRLAVIEAGTGTGKTLAYLIPAIILAEALGKKLLLSTATVALQEQILFKDLPDLRLHGGLEFSFSLAKGRGRYLCLAKLDTALKGSDSQSAMQDLYGLLLDDGDTASSDLVIYQDMLDALGRQQWQGDRDDWPDSLEDTVWRGVAVDPGQCAGNRCSYFSQCCFFKARENLQQSDCIVANHDLVLADLSLGGGVILPAPEDSIYIFDEAHHLPAKATQHFSHVLRLQANLRWLEQIPGALLRLQGEASGPGAVSRCVEQVETVSLREQVLEHLPLFLALEAEAEEGNGRDVRQYTFAGGQLPAALQQASQGLELGFTRLAESLGKLEELLRRFMDSEAGELDRQQAENWYPLVGGMATRAGAAAALWQAFGADDPPARAPCARWLTFSGAPGEREVTLSCSPVLAADALGQCLWEEAFAAVLTSATLSALGSFDFLQMRSGLPDSAHYLRIPSPFDFGRAGVLMLPSKGFNPANARAHGEAIIGILPVILDPQQASLVLFSSRRQMQEVRAGLPGEWAEKILCQDDHGKQQLLKLHRERVEAGQGSILFGLASLAEGVDLPGDYCRHVVIAKIPFPVPNDPVEATLGEWVKSQGHNAFNAISVPEACLRLVQASGRLLRSEQDRGVITILDERMRTKVYGRQILDALPPYRRQFFDPSGLTRSAWLQWLETPA